ncbi:MAG TPA: hypothetical protein VFL12_10945, partial [Thermoanaerobaculia bacterium]|nr:hypothetical protein [Thermoanaerobaculia bacterium]
MGSASEKKPIRVCLFWVHPLVRSAFERALPGPAFRLEAVRLEPKTDVRQAEVPAASLYVLDGAFARVALDALVSCVLTRNPEGRLLVVSEDYDEPS